MKNFFAALILGLALITTHSAFATPSEQECIQNSTTIAKKLNCLEDVTIKDLNPPINEHNIAHIELLFKQPVDHTNPSAGTFQQRIALIHRGETEPMVLQTSGYSIFGVRDTDLSKAFGTNQIQIEHRFFSDSKPANLDWTKLDIKQSAEDFHRITVAFKQIYGGKWVGTGASKGGMTSLYHRYFHTGDLDGTVADVAPLSFSNADERYIGFVDQVGGNTYLECREKLKAWQISLLQDREKFVPNIPGNYSQLGSSDVAFEHAVIESPFYFWQYGDPDSAETGCSAIPVNGTAQERYDFLNNLAPLEDYTDGGIARFTPYFYQAATELGSPDNLVAHLQHLRKYDFSINQYTPKNINYSYSNSMMLEVDQWARNSADHVMYVYGEFDPWSAGEFPTTETGKDVFKYFVPKGNHGADFTLLPSAQKALALETLTRWFGKNPINVDFGDDVSLNDIEFRARKRFRL